MGELDEVLNKGASSFAGVVIDSLKNLEKNIEVDKSAKGSVNEFYSALFRFQTTGDYAKVHRSAVDFFNTTNTSMASDVHLSPQQAIGSSMYAVSSFLKLNKEEISSFLGEVMIGAEVPGLRVLEKETKYSKNDAPRVFFLCYDEPRPIHSTIWNIQTVLYQFSYDAWRASEIENSRFCEPLFLDYHRDMELRMPELFDLWKNHYTFSDLEFYLNPNVRKNISHVDDILMSGWIDSRLPEVAFYRILALGESFISTADAVAYLPFKEVNSAFKILTYIAGMEGGFLSQDKKLVQSGVFLAQYMRDHTEFKESASKEFKQEFYNHIKG